MCLIVIPNFLKQSYGEIKTECLSKFGIVSQCVVEGTLRKKNLQSVATKILLQMIAKIGNVLWVPKVNADVRGVMIIAFDSAKGKGKNIISCITTLNDTFSNFFAKSAEYDQMQDKFSEMVKLSFEGINYCIQKTSSAPREIIILHNSCTNDQASLFRDYFLTALKKNMESALTQKLPSFTLVMINTKTSERFFTPDNRGVSNPQAGTLVSENIVS